MRMRTHDLTPDTHPITTVPGALLACTVLLCHASPPRPPVVLIHGSANSAGIWQGWQQALAQTGWSSYALDLRGHGRSAAVDLAHVSMTDYAQDVQELVAQLRQPPVLLGWSMGGLVALMVAARGGVAACVTLAPSVPALQVNTTTPLRTGVMTAAAYGITSTDPAVQPAMPDLTLEECAIALMSLGPESLYARDERQQGIVIPALPCPLLLVTGSQDGLWPTTRYADLWLPATRLEMVGASHWGLVLNGRALATYVPQIVAWLAQVCL